jgi:hypothetical protein
MALLLLRASELDMSAVEDLQGLAGSCAGKRQALVARAHKGTRWRKALNITAGVLALFSAASMTAVVAELTSSFGVKVVSAVVAFLSGITTLLVSSFFDEKEMQKAQEGAAKFLALRDQALLAARKPDMTEKLAFAELTRLLRSYNTLSAEYDRLISSWVSGVHYRDERDAVAIQGNPGSWHEFQQARKRANEPLQKS